MAKAPKKADKAKEAVDALITDHAAWMEWAKKMGARNAPDLANSKAINAAAQKAT